MQRYNFIDCAETCEQLKKNQLNDKYVVWQSTPKRQICRFGSQPSNDKNAALALKGLTLSTIFQLYRGGRGSRSARRKPPTCHK